jgi:hypothetical protein
MDQEKSTSDSRKPYSTPVLQVYGHLADVTAGHVQGKGNQDGQNNHNTRA